jgi:hypothetical protein
MGASGTAIKQKNQSWNDSFHTFMKDGAVEKPKEEEPVAEDKEKDEAKKEEKKEEAAALGIDQ